MVNRKINRFVQAAFLERNELYIDKLAKILDKYFQKFIITKDRGMLKNGPLSSRIDWFKIKERWDLFIIILAVLTSFLVPFELTFANHWNEIVAYQVISYFIDGFFFLDLIC